MAKNRSGRGCGWQGCRQRCRIKGKMGRKVGRKSEGKGINPRSSCKSKPYYEVAVGQNRRRRACQPGPTRIRLVEDSQRLQMSIGKALRRGTLGWNRCWSMPSYRIKTGRPLGHVSTGKKIIVPNLFSFLGLSFCCLSRGRQGVGSWYCHIRVSGQCQCDGMLNGSRYEYTIPRTDPLTVFGSLHISPIFAQSGSKPGECLHFDLSNGEAGRIALGH